MARTLIRNATSQVLPLPPSLGGLLVRPGAGVTTALTPAQVTQYMGGAEFVIGLWDLVLVPDANPDTAQAQTTSIAAADITDAGATGTLLVRAASASAARSTLGVSATPTATPANLLAAATPMRVFATDPQGNGVLVTGQQLAGLSRVEDPMTGSGWASDTPANGTVMLWASGKLTLTIPEGVAALGACGVAQSDYLPDAASVDLCVRIDFVSGEADTDTRTYIALGNSVTESVYLVAYGGGNYVVAATGVGGAPWTEFTVASSGLSNGDRTGGQLWLRLHRSPSAVVAMMGVGADGELPSSWAVLYVVTNTSAIRFAQGRWVRVSLDSGGAPVGGAIVDVLAIHASPAGAPL